MLRRQAINICGINSAGSRIQLRSFAHPILACKYFDSVGIRNSKQNCSDILRLSYSGLLFFDRQKQFNNHEESFVSIYLSVIASAGLTHSVDNEFRVVFVKSALKLYIDFGFIQKTLFCAFE